MLEDNDSELLVEFLIDGQGPIHLWCCKVFQFFLSMCHCALAVLYMKEHDRWNSNSDFLRFETNLYYLDRPKNFMKLL